MADTSIDLLTALLGAEVSAEHVRFAQARISVELANLRSASTTETPGLPQEHPISRLGDAAVSVTTFKDCVPVLATCGAWLRSFARAGFADTALAVQAIRLIGVLTAPSSLPWPYEWLRGRFPRHVIGFGTCRLGSQPHGPKTLTMRDIGVERACLGFTDAQQWAVLIGYTTAFREVELPRWRQLLELGNASENNCYARIEDELEQFDRTANSASQAAPECSAAQRRLGRALHAMHWRQVELLLSADDTLLSAVKQRTFACLAAKARFARGHHRDRELAGKALDAWFAESPFDAEGFWTALQQTGWLQKGVDGQSPWCRLTQFGGPMFGVFADDEVALLEHCARMETLTASETPTTIAADVHRTVVPGLSPEPASTAVNSNLERGRGTPPRQFFHALINADRFPAIRSEAPKLVRRGLLWARAYALFDRSFPHSYSVAGFQRGLEQLYGRETQGPVPKRSWNRRTLIWGLEQFAPTVLVDGCWLEQVYRSRHLPETVRDSLFRIYRDELGDGRISQNHPAIYRRLLRDAGLELPPIDSLQFIARPSFIPGAFDLPVYLMAIGLCSETFLPELLGLNLAIELSGLGHGYLGLIDGFRACGLDPTIVSVHLSIDNLASGHAALARDSIIDFVEQCRALGGDVAQQNCWRRVRLGYASLRAVLGRFVASLFVYQKALAGC